MCTVQRLPEPNAAIRDLDAWRDPDTDREANHAMWQEFAHYGLVDGQGRLNAGALDTLSILARPKTEHIACFSRRGVWRTVLVASGTSEMVIALRKKDRVALRSVRGESATGTLVRELPDAPPARIRSLNVRIDGADQSEHGQRDTLKLLDLARERLLAQGELSVGVRDHRGTYRHTHDNPIRYADYPSGRVLITLAEGYLSVAPATKTLLAERLTEAQRGLTR